VNNDLALDNKKLLCTFKPNEDFSQLSQNLKIKIDEKIKNISSYGKKKILNELDTCRTECTCDIYLLYLETQKDPEIQEELPALEVKAKSITPEKRRACARQFTEFCDSQLLKKIR
jgi:hypothetical protein